MAKGWIIYNLYDKDDNLVFAGCANRCAEFLGCGRNLVLSRYKQMLEINGYYIARRDEMMEYEKRRRNKKGYQRLDLWFPN